jgi:protein-tyrosine phosphatase
MPWVLRENLYLSGMMKPGHLDKHGWENVGLLTLCQKKPDASVILDDRVQWWKHMPLPDGLIRNNGADVWHARNTAISMMSQGYTTVIHCMAGRNRSGLIGALVLQHFENLTGAEALERIRQLRPNSVDNIYFEQFLINLGRPYP